MRYVGLVLVGLALACSGCEGETPLSVAPELEPEEGAFVNALGMRFSLIPAGSFVMGSEEGDSDEQPPHWVTIRRAFHLGRHEVTQRQWRAVMGSNPSFFPGDDRRPVESVSWYDVQRFIQLLNEQEGGPRYRLPTEAEWEYAARAGGTGDYAFGSGISRLGEYAWYSINSGVQSSEIGQPQSTGQKRANAFGLFDMHGNVWEWTQDWYSRTFYAPEAVVDPTGPASGTHRVIRGGSWFDTATDLRSANRGWSNPDLRGAFLGFRLVRERDE